MGSDQTAALQAAGLASEATTELLRFAREGDGLPGHPFGTEDPTVSLAQALITSATIEREGLRAHNAEGWNEEIAALSELIKAAQAYLTAWGFE